MPERNAPVKPARTKRRARPASNGGSEPGPAGPLHKFIPWHDIIPAGQWAVYRSAIEAVRNAGLRFLLGGGFGLATYSGRWRNTKDIDLYILPRDREATIAALTVAGFVDYFDQHPYDPGWIYRSIRDGIIVDIIWSMANRRAEVDELWFARAGSVQIREETVHVVPPEELLWCKLYILQRDHSDWTDIFNVLYSVGPQLDWDHLLHRVGPDLALLQGALTVFFWLCPNRARDFPVRLRNQLHLPKPEPVPASEELHRVKLLDSRAWFAPFQIEDRFLEV